MNAWLEVPRGWLDSFGEIARFGSRVAGLVYSGRVLRFFGESLRQAGILILGSALIIWGLVFILGLQCGIEGAYLLRAQGAPAYAGVFSAWCDLREIMPYAFGYMLSAKVGTGIVAELGAMRISDEIDALEVMGVPPVTFLCATRLLAAWIAFPFMYLCGIGIMYFASYLAVVTADRRRLLRRLPADLLDVPEPSRSPLQFDQGHVHGHRHSHGRLLLRLHGVGRPGWGRHRHREVDGPQHRLWFTSSGCSAP